MVCLMPNNLPESEIVDLREYIYIDESRVQNLLAQLGDGALVDREVSNSRTKRIQANLRLVGAHRDNQASETQRLATADLHVSMFEENATALGMLADVSSHVVKEKAWKQGKLRKKLEPGMLVRVTAPTQLIDPESITGVLREFATFSDDHDQQFDEMLNMAGALYGECLSLSIRPTESEDARCAFLGLIPHSHSFMGLQRDLLFSRMGPETPRLTSILQVARVPTERDTSQPAMQQLEQIASRIEKLSDDSLSRELFDDLMVQMGRAVEDVGLRSAPKWPAIAVIPLAIYRHVMPPPSFDDFGPK